jgi:hypothetical protein
MRLLYLLILIACSCTEQKSPPYAKIAHKITDQTAKKLGKEAGLKLIGTGSGMMYNVRMLAMAFRYSKEIDIDEGRELLMKAVSEYLSAINSNEEIRPYLINYPFLPKNIQIRIFLSDSKGREIPLGQLAVIGSIDGVFEYLIEDPKTTCLKTIYEETYEEALQKSSLNSVEMMQ